MRNELASTKISKEYRDQLSNIKSVLDKLVIKSRDPSTSEDDKDEIEKIISAVDKVLELDREEKKGKGLKIITPQQMLSKVPISLAQLKAGNNFEKVNNEIRQLLYSLYTSRKLSKTIYEHLINAI